VIKIFVERRSLQISPQTQALAAAASSRQALKSELLDRLSAVAPDYAPVTSWSVHPDMIRALVRLHSEESSFLPLEEIASWMKYTQGLYLLPGMSSLFYARTDRRLVLPNRSAIAALGEAALGLVVPWLYPSSFLIARPVLDYPDCLFDCPANNTVYLAESKATTQSEADIKATIDSELARFVLLVSACAQLEVKSSVAGLLVGTVLVSTTEWKCFVSEITV
jgi:hypothetical protein